MIYIYFGADWCGPCNVIKPQVQSSGKVNQFVDVDQNKEMATKYNVRSIPTILGIDGDNVVERYSGTQITQFINR